MIWFTALTLVGVAILVIALLIRGAAGRDCFGTFASRRDFQKYQGKTKPVLIFALSILVLLLSIVFFALFTQRDGVSATLQKAQYEHSTKSSGEQLPDREQVPKIIGFILLGIWFLLCLNPFRIAFRHYRRIQSGECTESDSEKYKKDLKLSFRVVNFGAIALFLIALVTSFLFYYLKR